MLPLIHLLECFKRRYMKTANKRYSILQRQGWHYATALQHYRSHATTIGYEEGGVIYKQHIKHD